MIDNDDDDDDDMIIIAVFLGCVIFDLRSGGPSSLFRVPPKKKIKRLITVYFFAVAIWPRYFLFIIDSVIFKRVSVSIVHDC